MKIERDQDGEERVFYLLGGVWVPEEERTRCEVWSRVMGYFRPVSEWNIGVLVQRELDKSTFDLSE